LVDRITIINRALLRIGSDPLQGENMPGAETHVAVYDSVVDDICSCYPWSFATPTVQLARETDPPAQFWKYAHKLPADLIGPPRAVYERSDRAVPLKDFAISGDLILSNAPDIRVKYVVTPLPALWPGYFRELIVLAVAAELALAVREDRMLRNQLREDVYGPPAHMGESGKLGVAKNTDAMGHPGESMDGDDGANPLIDVRF
jgi:hypothetical protein